MKFNVTFTKEQVVEIHALDKDDLMQKIEKWEKQGWNYEHAREEAK
jgi:hypothetical protein